MTCEQCNKSVTRLSGMVRSILINGFEVLIRVRRHAPGNAHLCDDCVDRLVRSSLDQIQLDQITRATRASEERERPSISRL